MLELDAGPGVVRGIQNYRELYMYNLCFTYSNFEDYTYNQIAIRSKK